MDILLVIQQNSKRYKFYFSNYSTRIVESGNARFVKNNESIKVKNLKF